MRIVGLCILTLLSVAGCSNPEPVAQLDMSTYWYSASATAATDAHCQTFITMAGGSKVKCE